MLVEWLTPVAAFWPLAAMYLGGTSIRIEGGGGPRQLGGLLLSFALYLGVFGVVLAALGGVLGTVHTVVAGVVAASLLLPLACRLGFLVLGVKLRKGEGGHHEAASEA